MKLICCALLAAMAAFASGEFRHHLTGPTLDVYVGEVVESKSDIPDAPLAENRLLVTVKTSDEMSQAVMVWIMVRLNDQTRIARTAVLRRVAGTSALIFSFPLGACRPVELVDIHVDNLRKTFADAIAEVY